MVNGGAVKLVSKRFRQNAVGSFECELITSPNAFYGVIFFFALFAIIRPSRESYTPHAAPSSTRFIQRVRDVSPSFNQNLLTEEAPHMMLHANFYVSKNVLFSCDRPAALIFGARRSVYTYIRVVQRLFRHRSTPPRRCGFLGASDRKEIRRESGLIDYCYCRTGYNTRNRYVQ